MKEGRVMFVDDEPLVLEGLKDLLRGQRKLWDFVWVDSGKAALEQLRGEPVDVVVSDIRMPVMDGATLLARVREEHPQIVRIVLSGHDDGDDMARASTVAQQMLSKPCDAGRLTSTLQRVFGLRKLLTQPRLREVVGLVKALPAAPRAYLEITRALANPNVKNLQLAAIVETDPAMTVKVLQLVNSAFFGLPQRMSSIQSAVGYLGAETLRAVALATAMFSDDGPAWPRQVVDRVQERSLLTARVARQIAATRPASDLAFTAGIVHDVGELLLSVAAPAEMKRIDDEAREGITSRHALEERIVGVSHASVGAYLMGTWGLPHEVVEAVAHHHEPSKVPDGDRRVLAALHAASGWVEAALAFRPLTSAHVDFAYIESAGLQPIAALRKMAAETVQKFQDAHHGG